MKITILMVLWLGFPLAYCLYAVFAVRRARKLRLHDLLLYRFCHVRDEIAMKAIRGEIDEGSQVFKFFYSWNASLIHEHKMHGPCFRDFARRVLGNQYRSLDSDYGQRPLRSEVKQLFRQLKNSDDETKIIAGMWIQACAIMLKEADRGMWVERNLWKMRRNRKDFFRWLSKQFFVSLEIRDAALFISGISRAIGFCPSYSSNLEGSSLGF
jgi:hypothetical protein